MKTSLPMILVVALCGCGPQSVISDGTYDSDSSAALANASLVVDVSAKTASLTLSGERDATVLQLDRLATADWERGCPTNVSSVAVETWAATPEPTVLGSLSLTGTRLLAGCGLDVADADTVVLKGTGEPNATAYVIAFKRR